MAEDWIDSTPAIDAEGNIYFGSWDDSLYSVNVDGNLRWSFTTESAVLASPLLVEVELGGVPTMLVVIGSLDGMLYALNASDGSQVWTYDADYEIQSSAVFHRDSLVAAQGLVLVGSRNNTVHAVHADTGEKAWSLDLSKLGTGSPPVDLDVLVAGLALSSDGLLLAGSSNGRLYALEPDLGYLEWSYSADDSIDAQPAVGPHGEIYLASRAGILTCLDSVGFPNWSVNIGVVYYSGPAVGRDGNIYAMGSLGGGVSAFYQIDPEGIGGEVTEVASINDASPLLTPDGLCYVGMFDGRLIQYAVLEPPAESSFPQFRQSPERSARRTQYRSPFKQWLADWFGEAAADAPDSIADEGDGIDLVGEFAAGLDPTVADFPELIAAKGEANQWELTFWKNTHALDVILSGETAAGLQALGAEGQPLKTGEAVGDFEPRTLTFVEGPMAFGRFTWQVY